MNTKQLWGNCLLKIESGMSKANFSTWFKNTSILKEEAGIIYIGVPNEFVRDWLINKYHKQITNLLPNKYKNKAVRQLGYFIERKIP